MAHFAQRGEIRERDVDLRATDPLGHKAARRLGAGRVAAGHDDAHPGLREAQRRIEPDPRTRSGDDADSLRCAARHVSVRLSYSDALTSTLSRNPGEGEASRRRRW